MRGGGSGAGGGGSATIEAAARKRGGCPDTPPGARGSQPRFIKGFLRRLALRGLAPRLWLLLGTPCRAVPRCTELCRCSAPGSALPRGAFAGAMLRSLGAGRASLPSLQKPPRCLAAPSSGLGRTRAPGRGHEATCHRLPCRRSRGMLGQARRGFLRGSRMGGAVLFPSASPLLAAPGAGGGLGRGTGVGSAAGPHPPVAEPQPAPRRSWQGCTKSPLIRCGHFGVHHLVTREKRRGQGRWLLPCLPFPGNGMERDPGSASALSLAHG